MQDLPGVTKLDGGWHEECDGPICPRCDRCACEGGCSHPQLILPYRGELTPEELRKFCEDFNQATENR